MACPPKYRQFGDFQQYYNGIKKAPVLTVFIGGNHEASNVLRELYVTCYCAMSVLTVVLVVLLSDISAVGWQTTFSIWDSQELFVLARLLSKRSESLEFLEFINLMTTIEVFTKTTTLETP